MFDGPRSDKRRMDMFPMMKHLLLSDVGATFQEDENMERTPFWRIRHGGRMRGGGEQARTIGGVRRREGRSRAREDVD